MCYESIIERRDEVNFNALQYSRDTLDTFEDNDFRYNEASVHIKFQDENETIDFEVKFVFAGPIFRAFTFGYCNFFKVITSN